MTDLSRRLALAMEPEPTFAVNGFVSKSRRPDDDLPHLPSSRT